MKKLFLLCGVWLFFSITVFAQRTIQVDQFQMVIDQVTSITLPVQLTDPVHPQDDEPIRLFKKYFNTSSLAAFRSFFTEADWGGFSQAKFNEWQQYIRNNPYTLEKTIQLHDQFGNAYIILQYQVNTPHYVIPGTAIFKRINQQWKHISFINDPQAEGLHTIGMLTHAYLQNMADRGPSRSVQSITSNDICSVSEKFDRKHLFTTCRQLLEQRSVSEEDISLAETLFLEKAEVDMVKYIGSEYSIDPYELMRVLNQQFGFELFVFSDSGNSN